MRIVAPPVVPTGIDFRIDRSKDRCAAQIELKHLSAGARSLYAAEGSGHEEDLLSAQLSRLTVRTLADRRSYK